MSIVPLRVVGDTVVVEDLPGHFERIAIGVHDGGGGEHDDGPVPVVVRQGPVGFVGLDATARAQMGDLGAFTLERLRLRLLLDGHHAPRVLQTLTTETGACAGFVEEHVGDVSLPALRRALRAQTDSLIPVPVAMAILRGACVPLLTLEAVARNTRTTFDPVGVFVGHDGVVRTLMDPYPGWTEMARGTAVGVVRGTYAYLSPEVVAGRVADGRAPMYSIGVMLFELLTGRHPFESESHESPIRLLQAIFQQTVPSLPGLRPDVPGPVAHLVERLTRRAANERYDDWASVVAAVDAIAARLDPVSPAMVADFVRGLMPEEMARAADRREEAALVDLPRLRASLPVEPGFVVAAPRIDVPLTTRDRVVAHLAAEELHAWHERTPPESDAPWLGKDGCAMWVVTIDGEDILVDASPVTNTVWARYCMSTGHPPPSWWDDVIPPPDTADLPVTGISHDEATGYALHFDKTLPTDDVWARAVEVLGTARLGVGAVWEWTSTRSRMGAAGFVVRGGRYRNTRTIPSEGFSRAWEDSAADDVGFRCVSPAPRLHDTTGQP